MFYKVALRLTPIIGNRYFPKLITKNSPKIKLPIIQHQIIALKLDFKLLHEIKEHSRKLFIFAVLGLCRLIRFISLAALYGPLIITFPIWYYIEHDKINNDETPRLWWVKWMVWTIETSGPTFIKVFKY